MLTNKRKNTILKNVNYFKSFIEYPNNMDNIYKNIEEFNSNKNAILSATIPNKSFGHLLGLDISRKIWYF